MEELNIFQRISVWVIPVLLAITVHEVAHGWVANRLGDPTARMLGRLSLNPIKHVDPVGTIVIPGLMLIFSPFVFGWAKPVPVTWQNLKRPKTDMVYVAIAGPVSNLLMAIGWALMIRLGVQVYEVNNWMGVYIAYSGVAGVFINGILALVNMLPILPLDGGRVLSGFLPGPMAYKLSRLEPYGFIVLVALMVTGILGYILNPVLSFLVSGMARVGGVSPTEFQTILWFLVGN